MDGSPRKALRQAASQSIVRVIGAPNALMARQIESFGFEACYLSGAVLSAGVLGLPDVGLFTATELVQHATFLTRRIDIPLIVDADTGFGDAVQVERTVIDLEAAGVAAIQLEDQQLPKRCGHLSGKTLVETDEMCAKLRAACSARQDDDLVIVARTDARGVDGFSAAVDRARSYVDSGADWVFPEALRSAEEFAEFVKRVPVPLMANMTEFGQSPLLGVDRLAEIGISAALFPVTLLRVAMRATRDACAVLADKGTQQSLLDIMQTREELYELLDYNDFQERDRSFFGGKE